MNLLNKPPSTNDNVKTLSDQTRSKTPLSHTKEQELEPTCKSFPVVGIGASAGGLEAFQDLLQNLSPKTGMSFVLIQHLDPNHESMLTSILGRSTKMPVLEAKDEMPIAPNYVYVIPPNTCMCIKNGILNLEPRPDGPRQNLPIDYFFHSLANDWGSQAIGVILSGTASDGSQGIMAIKDVGGFTFAQDEKTAKFNMMPRNAVLTECVDFVLTAEDIAKKLIDIASHPYISPSEVNQLLSEEEPFKSIMALLRKSCGVDFTQYKPTTVKRRIARRMVLNKVETLNEYIKILEESHKELERLHQDILIRVTRFFRDAEAFDALKKDVFPGCVKNKSAQSPLRIWVPGCSTGEEVYSIAISLLEFLGDQVNRVPFQIFGTDLNDNCVNVARSGIYPPAISTDVSEERLRRFFVKTQGGYQILKSIRDQCVFSRQNVCTDPPFSRMDLISCRNLLIYLGHDLQKRVFPMFHYALNPDGFLMLGQSENIVSYPDLFAVVNKSAKIHSKKATHTPPMSFGYTNSGYGREPFQLAREGPKNADIKKGSEVLKEADHIILAKYNHAGVVVNANMEILQFRGDTSFYLKHTPGAPNLNLIKMAREGLSGELHIAIDKVKKDELTYKKEGVRIKHNGGFKAVFIEVIPLRTSSEQDQYFLILFGEDGSPVNKAKTVSKKAVEPPKDTGSRITGLEQELASTKIYMQSIIEEREAVNDELQSANEEILSSNEELQSLNEELYSANEELQTAKEELQASNEEINTVNDELQNRNIRLTQLSDDLENVLTSIHLPVVIVGGDLKIRRFTPKAEGLFRLIPTDIGRLITDIKLKLNISDLEELISDVIKNLTAKEREIQDNEGFWHRLRIRPYRTSDNKIDGAVITLIDIDALKKKEEVLKDFGNFKSSVIETMRDPLLVLDSEFRVKMANQSFYQTFRTSPKETENRLFYSLGSGQWDIVTIHRLLETILPKNTAFDDYEVAKEFPGIGHKVMTISARQVQGQDKKEGMILLAISDITYRKESEEALKQSKAKLESANTELEQFAYVASHDLQEPLRKVITFTERLKDQTKALGEEAKNYCDKVYTSGLKMQRVIQDLLNYSRIGSQNLTYEETDLNRIVNDVLADLELKIEETKTKIEVKKLPTIQANKSLIRHLFQNLILNSIKYAKKEEPSHITIESYSHDGLIEIRFKDNGIGFDEKYLDKIFKPFQRLHAKNDYEGAGIGLSICQKIATQHGGQITANSKPGAGATFIVALPLGARAS